MTLGKVIFIFSFGFVLGFILAASCAGEINRDKEKKYSESQITRIANSIEKIECFLSS